MSDFAEVIVMVEGPTEQRFVKDLLTPYMADRAVFLTAIILSKPGEKGGDVKFSRAKNDIGHHLAQRKDTYVTLMVDYYGISSHWPGYDESGGAESHTQKSEIMSRMTLEKVSDLFPGLSPRRRFIPYFSMYEIEALYFSDPKILSEKLGIKQAKIDEIVAECNEPENINNSIQTAPSKRLEKLCGRFKKTTTGLSIARDIGISRMRDGCPIFNGWIETLESLAD